MLFVRFCSCIPPIFCNFARNFKEAIPTTHLKNINQDIWLRNPAFRKGRAVFVPVMVVSSLIINDLQK